MDLRWAAALFCGTGPATRRSRRTALSTDVARAVDRLRRGATGDGTDWIERLARLGFAARGLLYAVIGGTALRVAVGSGGAATGSQGALRRIAQGPFGTALLVATGVGLAGYAAWRLVQTFTASSDRDQVVARVLEWVSYPLRALVYGALSFSAFRIALGSGGSSGGSGGGGITSALLRSPAGQLAVSAVGVGVILYGAILAYQAVSRDFEDELRVTDRGVRPWLVRVGVVGFTGRAAAYLLTGGFVVHGAITADPQRTRGLDHALGELASTTIGTWLLGAVALGLLTFAAYSLAEARYRRIDVD